MANLPAAEARCAQGLRSLTGELQQVYHGLGASASTTGPAEPTRWGDDVIDAEFTTPE
jgi:molecular chaperone DnaK